MDIKQLGLGVVFGAFTYWNIISGLNIMAWVTGIVSGIFLLAGLVPEKYAKKNGKKH